MRKRRRAGVPRDLSKVTETLARVADIVRELHRTRPDRAKEETLEWTEEK